MNFLKRLNPEYLIAIGAVVFFAWSAVALAAPRGSPYLPGQTLNPTDCSPGETNCTVVTPPAGTGSAGALTYWLASSTVSSTPFLYWDNTDSFLGVGTTSPAFALDVVGAIRGATILAVNVSSTNLSASGYIQGLVYDLQGNKYATSGFSNGVDSQLLFGMLGGGATSSAQLKFTSSTSQLLFSGSNFAVASAATSSALVLFQGTAVASTTLLMQGVTNQTANLLQVNSSTGITLFSIGPTGVVSSTEFRTASSTISGNLVIAGYSSSSQAYINSSTISTLTVTSYVSSSQAYITSSTIWGNLVIAGYASSSQEYINSSTMVGLNFTNATSTGWLTVATASTTKLWFVNATGSGSLAILSNGFASSTPAFNVSGTPQATTTISLIQFGTTALAGGSANGTYLGINPSSFSGDFLNFEVNGLSKFEVNNGFVSSSQAYINSSTITSLTITSSTLTRTLYISSSSVLNSSATLISATSTLIVCAFQNCAIGGNPSTTNTVAYFASTDGTQLSNSIVARGQISAGSADIGEYAPIVGDPSEYQAGDLLSVSVSNPGAFEKSSTAYDPNLAGVVTETAGLIAGGGDDGHSKIVIALQGRVPVKVTGANAWTVVKPPKPTL